MKPYAHQIELSNQCSIILSQYNIVYLAAEERTGKTLTSILTAENIDCKQVLIVTKKQALADWKKTLNSYNAKFSTVLTNYHQVKKTDDLNYDLIILDESHNYISGYPKTSKLFRDLKRLTKNKKIMYISATPCAQGYQQLFNQFKLSNYSPFKAKNFYSWFQDVGKFNKIMLRGVPIMQYNELHSPQKVWKSCEHLFVMKTRKELNFEFEPVDKVHFIEPSEILKSDYNTLMKHNLLDIEKHDSYIADTKIKQIIALHQLEGGTIKLNEKTSLVRDNAEKIDFILHNFNDSENIAIMYHYKCELKKLSLVFKKAKLLQSNKYSEGISLAKVDHLIIYSQDFSTAKHIQRRARQCDKQRDSEIIVHFLLIKNAISHQVYTTVSKNKKNFTDKLYNEHIL